MCHKDLIQIKLDLDMLQPPCIQKIDFKIREILNKSMATYSWTLCERNRIYVIEVKNEQLWTELRWYFKCISRGTTSICKLRCNLSNRLFHKIRPPYSLLGNVRKIFCGANFLFTEKEWERDTQTCSGTVYGWHEEIEVDQTIVLMPREVALCETALSM